MRIVGKRKESSISYSARSDLLIEGARFNDEIHRLPGGQITCIPKGVYRFKTHAEANRQQEDFIIAGMVQLARERVK
jgi:hypothetical protein